MSALLFLVTPFICGMAFVGICAVAYVARVEKLRRLRNPYMAAYLRGRGRS